MKVSILWALVLLILITLKTSKGTSSSSSSSLTTITTKQISTTTTTTTQKPKTNETTTEIPITNTTTTEIHPTTRPTTQKSTTAKSTAQKPTATKSSPSGSETLTQKSAATESGSQTAATQSGSPTAVTQSGSPTAASELGPQTSAIQSGSSPAATQSGSTAEASELGPQTSAIQSGSPTAVIQSGSPTAASELGPQTSAIQSESSPAATQSGSTTEASELGPQTSAIQSESPTAVIQSGSTTEASELGPQTSAIQSGSTTAVIQSGSPTAVIQSGSPTAVIQSGSPTAVIQSGSTTAASELGSPTVGSQSGSTLTTTHSKSTTAASKPTLEPKLENKNVTIKYVLVINTSFNETLGKNNSKEYNIICIKYGKILEGKFRNTTGVNLTVKVTGLSKGSLIVDYDVNLPTLTTTKVNLFQLNKKLNDAATNWITFDDQNVDINRTKSAIKNTFLQSVCHCGTDEYVCVFKHESVRCEHKCYSTSAKDCGKDGHCVYDMVSKETKCLCKNTDNQITYGENCGQSMLKTTPDPLPVSKLTIIAISGGTGGALLLIILISTICFCYRLKQAKRNGSFSETSSKCDSDIIRDNKKMESIPLESGRLNPGYRDDRQESGRRYPLEQPQTTKSNPLYRDDYGDQRKGYQTDPEPRYQDHDRISRGSFNPQTSNDRLRTESSGNRQPVKHYNDSEASYRDQRESENSYRPRGISSERNNRRVWPEEISRDRNNSNDIHYPKGRSEESSIGDDRYVYIEGDGGVRRLFKRVDDKDLGGETLIYQPSNMPRPIQRENVDSVGDNFIMRPAPPQDNERRSSFYETIDSENPYKIKRPIIRHNNLYS